MPNIIFNFTFVVVVGVLVLGFENRLSYLKWQSNVPPVRDCTGPGGLKKFIRILYGLHFFHSPAIIGASPRIEDF